MKGSRKYSLDSDRDWQRYATDTEHESETNPECKTHDKKKPKSREEDARSDETYEQKTTTAFVRQNFR